MGNKVTKVSVILEFTDKDESERLESMIDTVCKNAEAVVGRGVQLRFTFIPAAVRDQSDPLGQRSTMGWQYDANFQHCDLRDEYHATYKPVPVVLHDEVSRSVLNALYDRWAGDEVKGAAWVDWTETLD